MNDIEILEEFIKYFEAEATQRKYRRNISITVGEDDIEALENLIQEYKKLKKQMGKDLDVVYIKGVYDERDKWKNKLKEKLKHIYEEYNSILIDEKRSLQDKNICTFNMEL